MPRASLVIAGTAGFLTGYLFTPAEQWLPWVLCGVLLLLLALAVSGWWLECQEATRNRIERDEARQRYHLLAHGYAWNGDAETDVVDHGREDDFHPPEWRSVIPAPLAPLAPPTTPTRSPEDDFLNW